MLTELRYTEDSPDVLNAMENLAITKRQRGFLEAAEMLEEEVLVGRRKIGDEDSPDALNAMGNLAITKRKQGKYAQAINIQERVFKLRLSLEKGYNDDVL
jgi:Tetratricopeptide repeat